jgi:hypothetical protein
VADNHITVIIVVSGEELKVQTNSHQPVRELVHKALNESGNHGQSPDNWVIRTDAGPVSLDLTVGAAGLHDGVKLYLSPKTGEGGN